MVSSYSPLNDEEGEGLRTLGGILQPPSNFQLFFPPTAKARGRRKEVDRTRYSEMHGKSAGCASSVRRLQFAVRSKATRRRGRRDREKTFVSKGYKKGGEERLAL